MLKISVGLLLARRAFDKLIPLTRRLFALAPIHDLKLADFVTLLLGYVYCT